MAQIEEGKGWTTSGFLPTRKGEEMSYFLGPAEAVFPEERRKSALPYTAYGGGGKAGTGRVGYDVWGKTAEGQAAAAGRKAKGEASVIRQRVEERKKMLQERIKKGIKFGPEAQTAVIGELQRRIKELMGKEMETPGAYEMEYMGSGRFRRGGLKKGGGFLSKLRG